MDRQQLEEMSDMYFPIRKEGAASYREGQKQTIVEVGEKLFIENKKFVAIEAMTGSGKSAINTTLNKIAGDKAIYFTPFVMLQDQIMGERWPGMRCVKGGSNYLCSVFGIDDTNSIHNCDYDGPDADTCNSIDHTYKVQDGDVKKICDQIVILNEMYGDDKVTLEKKTSFKTPEEFTGFLLNLQKKIDDQEAKLMASRTDAPSPKKKKAIDAICCNLGARECPKKSSKKVAELSSVVVMNPDIFFYLTKNEESIYHKISMMTFDECQQIEGVINRLFKTRIPIESIDRIFGIESLKIFNEGNKPEDMVRQIIDLNVFVESKFSHIAAMGDVFKRLGDILLVSTFDDVDYVDSENAIVRAFNNCKADFMKMPPRWKFPWIDFFDSVFSGTLEGYEGYQIFDQFYEAVRDFFIKKCEEYECEYFFGDFKKVCEKFEVYCEPFLNKLSNDDPEFTPGRPISKAVKKRVKKKISYNYNLFKCFSKISSSIGGVVETVKSLNKMSENEGKYAYILDNKRCPRKEACQDMQAALKFNSRYDRAIEMCVDIVIVNTGKVMNKFFYSKADKVVLSSGTWVLPERLFGIYGLPGNCDLVKMKSTFPKSNRPIYVVSDMGLTDFSAKVPGTRDWIYKTQEGTVKFVNELEQYVNMSRDFITKHHSKNANILVHCNSFEIARRIAEFTSDENMLIHLDVPVRNVNGKTFQDHDKDYLIKQMVTNPDCGLTLVSCSMVEGVDFKDDIARCQIVLKNPSANYMDPYIQTRLYGNKLTDIIPNKEHYNCMILTALMQQYGRIIRSQKDWGYMLVLDQATVALIRRYLMPHNAQMRKDLNIEYFLESVQHTVNRNGSVSFVPFYVK